MNTHDSFTNRNQQTKKNPQILLKKSNKIQQQSIKEKDKLKPSKKTFKQINENDKMNKTDLVN